MQQLLVYADSLSWGIVPGTRERLPFDERWPGVLENHLRQGGRRVRVIENCLNGRRTAWEDPFKAGRDGRQGLAQVIEMHSPLDLVILMLGTNDFQRAHDNNAFLSAQGTASLVQLMRQAPLEPGMPAPAILLVAPPPILEPRGAAAEKFAGANQRCLGLAEALKTVADEAGVQFLDAAAVVTASQVDGVHLDAPQHRRLGEHLATWIDRSGLLQNESE